ncbi:hypothetical protein AVEN_93478-1 [Araneus ventricosus]|uniref:Uncharacterized protein n=1 Tax=Araneus ventricosus TaxID=182803 RepID=A0A4Y2APN2_ARAVE|nr:hypothetical protein AVEN_93478-1 [Araneus ventricosus]
MIGAKSVAAFAMLPWIWGLFQVFVYGDLWYIIYLIPYFLCIQQGEKKTAQKGTNVDKNDSTLVERKDACISTDDTDFVTNANDEMIELNNDCGQNIFCENNPFLHTLESPGAHGNELVTNPFISKDANQLHPSGIPFLEISATAVYLNAEETNRDLFPTNPFLQDCSNNQIIDTSIFFPNGFDHLFNDISPTESDIYCKEWIEKHRKCFIKTVRSFSIH